MQYRELSRVPGLNTNDPDRLIYTESDLKVIIWGGISLAQMNRLKVNVHIKSQSSQL